VKTCPICWYEGVSESFRTGFLERELQIALLSASKCRCIAILWVSLASFAPITLRVASQRVFFVVYFFIDSVRKLLDTPSYNCLNTHSHVNSGAHFQCYRNEKWIQIFFFLQNLKGRDHLEDLGVDGKIILKWILRKVGKKLWTRCIWLRIGTSGGLLWTH
jgi:hypothetical protein